MSTSTTITTIKRGDTAPVARFTLSDGGKTVDLTQASSIRIIGVRAGAVIIDKPVTGDALGVILYTWVTGDTAVLGSIKFEFEVIWANSSKQSFPKRGFVIIEVVEDLA